MVILNSFCTLFVTDVLRLVLSLIALARVFILAIFLVSMFTAFPLQALEDFDRLFTTAQERVIIDEKIRQSAYHDGLERNNPGAETSSSGESDVANPPSIDHVKLSGFVRRSDGKEMIWVNGKSPISKDFTGYGVDVATRIRSGGVIRMRAGDSQVNMLPGQVWNVSEGIVEESFATDTLEKEKLVDIAEVVKPPKIDKQENKADIPLPKTDDVSTTDIAKILEKINELQNKMQALESLK